MKKIEIRLKKEVSYCTERFVRGGKRLSDGTYQDVYSNMNQWDSSGVPVGPEQARLLTLLCPMTSADEQCAMRLSGGIFYKRNEVLYSTPST
jgi:hypothetical protein